MSKIKEIRQQQNLRLADVATDVGISIAYLSDIENGNRHGSEKTRKLIADRLGVSLKDLTDE